MNVAQNVAKNAVVLAVSYAIESILNFFLLIYIARYLGEEEFGIYSYALSLTSIFIIFTGLGANNLLIREIARNKEHAGRYLANIIAIKFPLSIVSIILVYLVTEILNSSFVTKYTILIFTIYMVLSSFATLFRSLFQAYEIMEYDAFIGIIEKLSLLLLILFAFSKGYGLIELAYIYVISALISMTLSISLILKKLSKTQYSVDISLCKSLIIESIPFGLNALFGILFFRIDTIMLSALKNDAQVGIYNAAYNPLLALGVVPSVFVAAIYPVMSRTFMSSKNSLDIITKLSSKYMALLGFPIAMGCIILADKFIKLLYADQFSSSIVAFQILAFFIPLRWISSITGTFLTSTNRQSFRTLSVGLSAILNIILNAILIPHFGYIGASISTVISEIFLYFIIIYYINKLHKKLEIHCSFIKPLAASLIMGIFIYLIRDANLFLLIVLAGIIYFIILMLMKTFGEDDFDILRLIFKRC